MAISFDGYSSKVVIDTSTVLDNTSDYSVNFKIRLTDLTGAFVRCISYRDGARGFQVVQEDDNLFIFGDGVSSTTWGRDSDVTSGDTNTALTGLSVDTWYNVTVNFAAGALYTVPTVWQDGVAVTNDGNSALGGSAAGYGSGTDIDAITLGARCATGTGISLPGDCVLAELTIWQEHRVIADAVAMTAGTSGSTIGTPIIHYQGLDNTDTTETENSQTVTFTNTVVDFTHPTMLTAGAHEIVGDLTITSTPNATLDYNVNSDISGDVTITAIPNATMAYEVLSEIMGTTTISVTPSSSFDYTVSSNHTITGDVTVTAIANATFEYAAPALTMESDDFDSAIGNVSSITDAATLTPVINLVPDDQGDVGGWLMLCVRSASNMSGKTPEFVFDDVDCRFTGVQKPCWQYLTDDRNTWRAFDNVAAVGTIVTCSMNTPFTGEVEFATKPRWHYSDTQDWIAEVALDADAHELASSVAASGLPTNVHASIDPGATNANSFPQQDINLYGIRLSNDVATPAVGSKWPVVLLMGAHASEDQGNYMLQGFVDYLLGGSATANQLLIDYNFYIYDVNPHGRAYGKERWSEVDGANTDLNRAWDGTPSGTAVEDIITATGLDLSGPLKGMIDFHGNFQATYNFGAYYEAANTYDASFKSKMASKVTEGVYPYYGENVAGTSGQWALDEGALFAPTQEAEYYPAGHPSISAMYDQQGQAVAETLDEMRLEEVGTYAVSGDVTITAIPSATFEVAGSSGIIGDLTVTLTPNATVAYNVNSDISGDVTITSIPNATLDYNVNSDISGDVTITLTSNPALEHNVNATIVGDVTITAIPSAALEVSGSSGIFGDVTVSLTPNSSLNYNLNADISGDITATLTPNSTLAFSNGNELVGDVTVTLTSDSTLEFSNNFAVIGNIPISLTPNATMSFAGGNGIEGDITYTITPASALDYTKNAEIVGNITYNLTPTSSLIFEFASVISPVKNLEVLNASTIVLDVYVNI